MPTHHHLRRLDRLWTSQPVVFVTTCIVGRRPILCQQGAVEVLLAEWRHAHARHGWKIGRYVVMPDHVHFFCAAGTEGPCTSLSQFMGPWKEWTAKGLTKALGISAPVWQKQFFDHVLRSRESYAEKWAYVRDNPVRANLVSDAGQWMFAGAVDFDDPM
jgi:REP element-mobilizing transposase RayT